MESKEKNVFIIYDSKEAKLFSKCLKSRGIENEIGNYLGRKLIDVPKENYLECLEKGTTIAKKYGFKSIEWLNSYDEPRPLGYLSVMYCSLPNRRRGNSSWEILNPSEHGLKEDFCPIDIKIYLDGIKSLFGRNIAIKYNSADNAIEVMIEADLSEYMQLLEKFQMLNKYLNKTMFKKILYTEKDGSLIQVEEKEKVDKTGINSYLYQSLFFEGLAYPQGSNISPKTSDDTNTKATGFKTCQNSWGLRMFDVTSDVDNGTYIGNFVSDIEKTYNYYWDADERQQTNMRKSETFTMIDNGNFLTKINVENSIEVIVDTTIKVIRNVVGYNYDGVTIRDGYFGNSTHEDSRFDIRIREYFKIIKPNRMIHYSDNSNFVELYNLTEGWTITDGLDKLGYPIVYDDTKTGELEKDEDYALIKGIMDTKVEKGDTRVLTPKSHNR